MNRLPASVPVWRAGIVGALRGGGLARPTGECGDMRSEIEGSLAVLLYLPPYGRDPLHSGAEHRRVWQPTESLDRAAA